jgi:hypothetical protein
MRHAVTSCHQGDRVGAMGVTIASPHNQGDELEACGTIPKLCHGKAKS